MPKGAVDKARLPTRHKICPLASGKWAALLKITLFHGCANRGVVLGSTLHTACSARARSFLPGPEGVRFFGGNGWERRVMNDCKDRDLIGMGVVCRGFFL